MSRILAILAICFMSSACAIGVKHNYDATDLKFDVPTENNIAVAVHDQRLYVVEGGKAEKFVGLSRGGFGNPFNIVTESSKPLAEDMTTSIVAALRAGGAKTLATTTAPQQSSKSVLAELLATKSPRSVLLRLDEWKSDSFMATTLKYNVLLVVYGPDGLFRGKKRLQGADVLGRSGTPAWQSPKVVPVAYRGVLSRLFSDPAITDALK